MGSQTRIRKIVSTGLLTLLALAAVSAEVAPTAVLTAPASVAFGQSIHVSGAHSVAEAGHGIVRYRWRLDDGDPLSTPDPTFTFHANAANPLTTGPHRVELVVVDDRGLASAPDARDVIVRDTVAPSAVVAVPRIVGFGQSVTASGADSFDIGGEIVSYRWRLDGGAAVVTDVPSVTFSVSPANPLAIGRHSVQLVVTDDSGNVSSPDSRVFTVADQDAPTAVLEIPDQLAQGQSLTASGNDSFDIGGSIARYAWSLDGGPVIETDVSSFTFVADPAHPLTIGTHTVQLVVADDSGNVSLPDVQSFRVLDAHVPTAFIQAPAVVPFGQSFTVSGGNSVDFDGTIQRYVWRLDSQGPIAVNAPTFTFTFVVDPADPLPVGIHTVELVVRDDAGNLSDPAFATVRVVDDQAPTAIIDAPRVVPYGHDITASGDRSVDFGGVIVQYHWRLDGGPVLAFDVPTVTFPFDPAHPFFPGLHQVELVVVDDSANHSQPETVQVRVTDGLAPTAVIQVPRTVQIGQSITVSGADSVDLGGFIRRYIWSLDDLPPIVTETPTHTFVVDPADPLPLGRHSVQLVVEDDSANQSLPDTATFVVVDSIAPTAVITGPATLVFGEPLPVSGADSFDIGGRIIEYQWTLDDQPTIVNDHPAQTFGSDPAHPLALGEHLVQLVVVDDSGNESLPDTFRVRVLPPPDTAPPTIVITTPAQGAGYQLNQAVTADYACADADSGVASCAGPLPNGGTVDTSSVGTKEFTVTATDNAGNKTQLTHTYSVGYNFAGFFSPVDNLPVINSGNAGRTFPIKWRLATANGTPVTALTSFVSMLDSPIACDASPDDVLEEELATTTGAALHYDAAADQFVFNWKTNKAWVGCRLLQLTLADGSRHYAKFRLR